MNGDMPKEGKKGVQKGVQKAMQKVLQKGRKKAVWKRNGIMPEK